MLERNITSPKWFAGALEAGGTLTLPVQRRKNGHVSSYPYVQFQEPKEEFIDALKAEFGGSKSRAGTSWHWVKGGYAIAELMVAARSYAVSRREMVLALENWLQADSGERAQIAQQMKGYDRFNDGSVEEYAQMASSPEFMAGVIDNRGSISPIKHLKTGTSPALYINSKNRLLLDGIRRQYGFKAELLVGSKVGQTIEIDERKAEVKRGSWRLSVSSEQARALLAFVQPHLKVPPYSGWDEKPSDLISAVKQQHAGDIQEYVLLEFEELAIGNLSRLSTAAELGEMFGVSGNTIRRRLAGLPQDILNKRAELSRGATQRLLSDKETQAIVDLIIEDVESFSKGGQDRIHTVEDWASFAGVKRHIIITHVMPLLPEATRKQRFRMISTQAAFTREHLKRSESLKNQESQ